MQYHTIAACYTNDKTIATRVPKTISHICCRHEIVVWDLLQSKLE
jgi:hypothetical protein